MQHHKSKILIISKNRYIAYRVYINLIAFNAEIDIVKNISQINKNIFLDDYDLVIINISKLDDLRKLKLINIKKSKSRFLFIHSMQIFKKNSSKNFLNFDFSDTDIILKTNTLLNATQ